MDVKRIVLLLSLAVVSYLLVLQWNLDYGQPQPQATSPDVQQDAGTVADGSDIPTQAADGDMPSTEPVASAATRRGLIRVTTDVLDLRIDPKGGDIVYAALPKHKRRIDTPNTPFVLLERNADQVYVAQSGLAGADGPDASSAGRPLYQTEQTAYQLDENADRLQVDLLLTQENGTRITKRFTFERNSYAGKVEYLIDNQSQSEWNGYFFAQLKRDNSPDPSAGMQMGMQSFLGAAVSTPEEPYEKISFEEIQESRFRQEAVGGWIAILQHYFISAWVPAPDEPHVFRTRTNSQNHNIIGLTAPQMTVAPGEQAQIGAEIYMGPKIQERLDAIAPNLELTVDFGWLWFIAQPLFWLLDHIENILGNWGWSIVVLTLMVKLAFFHLSATAYRSMANMRRLAPELQKMRERYADDRQKLSQAMMELYRKEKINPLGGCLPILVQMPVFIALYWMLLESVELRHAPFMLWIEDLSVKDPYFVLPIIMGITMYIQQLLNPTPPDPIQARVMKFLPVVFTFFFLWFPAGLVIYWVSNNILSIAQQWVITRKIEGEAAAKAKA